MKGQVRSRDSQYRQKRPVESIRIHSTNPKNKSKQAAQTPSQISTEEEAWRCAGSWTLQNPRPGSSLCSFSF